MSIGVNLLLMGKTGVGKSALSNYLSNVDKFKVEAGKKGTEELINLTSSKANESEIHIYDSKAIELNSCWENSILGAFDAKKTKADYDVIIYCFSALEENIEAKEVEKIIEIRRINKNIIFAITNDDIRRCSNENLIKKLNDIGFTSNDIVRVSSEEKVYLNGQSCKRYGKEEILSSVGNKIKPYINQKMEKDMNLIISRRIPTWNLRCKSELKKNKSFLIDKNEKRDEHDLVEDFNLYIHEMEKTLQAELINILKKNYSRYSWIYNQELLGKYSNSIIESEILLPSKTKRSYNFAITDKIEKQLEKYWTTKSKEIIESFIK